MTRSSPSFQKLVALVIFVLWEVILSAKRFLFKKMQLIEAKQMYVFYKSCHNKFTADPEIKNLRHYKNNKNPAPHNDQMVSNKMCQRPKNC